MKKQILNLGKALNKAEQKSITGGGTYYGEHTTCLASCEFTCEPASHGRWYCTDF